MKKGDIILSRKPFKGTVILRQKQVKIPASSRVKLATSSVVKSSKV